MKIISLSKGKQTLVDDDIYEWAKDYKWHVSFSRGLWYAKRNFVGEDGKQHRMFLHHCITGQPLNNLVDDHKDGDTLNNQRNNLRIVTKNINQQNQIVHRSGQLSGVTLITDTNRVKPWRASKKINGKTTFLGYFATELEAHQATL